MIPCQREDLYEESLRQLRTYSRETGARGRFIALYLGLRRIRMSLAALGVNEATLCSEIESSMDDMLTKTHRPAPYVVLTAPFGGSTSPTAPYSPRSGFVIGPQKHPTNTWRNNMGVQKGVGCVASPEEIRRSLDSPGGRLSCPHLMNESQTGGLLCTLSGTRYRGELHSIWLRVTEDGYQVVDLDHPAVHETYLRPSGRRIPIFSLIAALYSFAPNSVYQPRASVGIPEFCQDFGFTLRDAEEIFECDPCVVGNAEVIAMVQGPVLTARGPLARASVPGDDAEDNGGTELPAEGEAGPLNTGVAAEVAVARLLTAKGWDVSYFGNTPGVGYDLVARRGAQEFRIEVKSSVGLCSAALTAKEWEAACRFGASYVVVAVDFCGGSAPAMLFLVDPAGTCEPQLQHTTVYKLRRADFAENLPHGLALS